MRHIFNMTKTVALRNSDKITILNEIYFLSVQIISPSYNDLNLQVDEIHNYGLRRNDIEVLIHMRNYLFYISLFLRGHAL